MRTISLENFADTHGFVHQDDWQANTASCQVAGCPTSFTCLTRRHHCHKCGKCVCNSCSRNRIYSRRVCNSCIDQAVSRDIPPLATWKTAAEHIGVDNEEAKRKEQELEKVLKSRDEAITKQKDEIEGLRVLLSKAERKEKESNQKPDEELKNANDEIQRLTALLEAERKEQESKQKPEEELKKSKAEPDEEMNEAQNEIQRLTALLSKAESKEKESKLNEQKLQKLEEELRQLKEKSDEKIKKETDENQRLTALLSEAQCNEEELKLKEQKLKEELLMEQKWKEELQEFKQEQDEAQAQKKYVFSQCTLPVTEAHDRHSKELVRLPEGTSIEVLEVAKEHSGQRVRARVAIKGWISTKMIDGARDFVGDKAPAAKPAQAVTYKEPAQPQPEMQDPRTGQLGLRVRGFYFPGRPEAWDVLCEAEFCGNFYPINGSMKFGVANASVARDGKPKERTFTNSEAAFQGLKFWNHPQAQEFENADGDRAFRLKRQLRPEEPGYGGYQTNWRAMEAVLRAKFSNEDLRDRLLATGDDFLLEHNARQGLDSVWSDNKDGTGTNWLGLQLMVLRDELRGTHRNDGCWTRHIYARINEANGSSIHCGGQPWQDTVKVACDALEKRLSS